MKGHSIPIVVLSVVIAMGSCQKITANPGKKKANASFNIESVKDTIKQSHLNIGLFSHISQLKGFGINVISSVVSGNVCGAQISGISNITGNNTKGFQLAGINNINGNTMSGISTSGFINIAGKNAYGALISGGINLTGDNGYGFNVGGLLNITGQKNYGVQLAGLANITAGGKKGIDIAGLANVSAGNLTGMQASSLLNVTDSTKGVQISALGNVSINVNGVQISGLTNIAVENAKGVQISSLSNIAGNVNGVQLGTFNFCSGEVKGVQIGVINYSKDTSAVKIGIINLQPKTKIQLLAFGGNMSKVNLAVRFKNRMTYTMLGVGAQYFDLKEKFSMSTFYRVGIYYPICKNIQINGDLGFGHIESFKNHHKENVPSRMYALQARASIEYYPFRKFGIFASGGYGITRYYKQNRTFEKKPIVEIGIILF